MVDVTKVAGWMASSTESQPTLMQRELSKLVFGNTESVLSGLILALMLISEADSLKGCKYQKLSLYRKSKIVKN